MQRYVFIAGGIGITPFRSMLKELLVSKKVVPITLFYCVETKDDVLFTETLEEAEQIFSMRTIFVLSKGIPKHSNQVAGKVTEQMLVATIPQYRHCLYYLSGSQTFIQEYQDLLLQMHISQEQIKTDAFSGYD